MNGVRVDFPFLKPQTSIQKWRRTMDISLHVKSSDDGPPQALIPNQYMWDLVESLAIQRVQAIYTYYDDHFIVSFPRMDLPRVQGLLDDWVACAARS